MISGKDFALAGLMLAGGSLLALAQGLAPAPYSDTQATAGAAAYAANCASCHMANLTGAGEAPPLAGTNFMNAWRGRTTKELHDIIHASMPLNNGGSLDDATYASIVAYILKANGAKPGGTAFSAASPPMRIGAVADGNRPAGLAAAAPPRSPGRPAEPGAPTRYGLMLQGHIGAYENVTDDMLAHPKDGDWLMYRRNYQGWSYSPLKQIDAGNVDSLQLKWSWAMNDGGASQITPIVHNGIMFLSNTHNTIQALNAVTGELLWENRIGPASPRGYAGTRSLALYQDKVYVATTDARLYALDVHTGKIAWKTDIADPAAGFSETGGVMSIHGKIVVGLTLCRGQAPHCYISAYDANTGKQVWKFTVIALTGQPGGDTWNGIPDNRRAGGETWIAGTYDPDLNLTYWGVAQAKPWMRSSRGTKAAAALFTSATLALNPDDGKLKWYYSHAPGENFDLDEVFERTLIDEDGQKQLVTIGKVGILWKLNRETGKFLDYKETVFQNVFKSIDPKTGVPTYRDDVVNSKVEDWLAACPSPAGGRDWPATSYDQPNDLIILPLSQSCNMMQGHAVDPNSQEINPAGSEQVFEMPGTDGNMGRLSAYSVKNLKPVWSFQQKSPFLTAVLSTGGGVAFVGDYDRRFRAVDVKTGKTLWVTRLSTVVQGHPVAFAVDGKEYIAVPTGLGGGSPLGKPTTMLPQLHHPDHGNALFVFALPEKMIH